ncbi:DUF6318 family protein [Actinotalea sp. K2]|uniref:DUF6318 family protein n=1 Tax=Actinotalea sp. K2 TaxID=2939438 RepID=UPI002017DF28|nr:DUF6318 family protein [Actinotalea sp. K2]MCL3863313.1 DUF6318 family protein [Actinotalea sp. K2]
MRAGGFVVIRGACRATGAAVAVAVLLAGCAQEPRPQPTSATLDPLPTPSPTPTVEPVTKPERPAEMDRTDEVGAAAAAEYFMSLYPYVLQTGDLTEWDAMTAATCGFCEGTRDAAGNVVGAGGTLEGGTIKVSVMQTTWEPAFDLFSVRTEVAEDIAVEKDADGMEVSRAPASTSMAEIHVAHVDDRGWILVEVIALDEGE